MVESFSGVSRKNGNSALGGNFTFIKTGAQFKQSNSGLGFLTENCPFGRKAARIVGKEGGMDIQGFKTGEREPGRGNELAIAGNKKEVGRGIFKSVGDLVKVFQREKREFFKFRVLVDGSFLNKAAIAGTGWGADNALNCKVRVFMESF